MPLTKWCSEDANVCSRGGAPINDDSDTMIAAGWKLRTNKSRHGWTFEALDTPIEEWTCPDCVRRLTIEAGTHYTFRRGTKRTRPREPVRLTMQTRQADNNYVE